MEEYLCAVSEMYPQFKQREYNPLERYIGRLVNFYGDKLEVVGYSYRERLAETVLIVDASQVGGWTVLEPSDVIFKGCESYWYVDVDDLID